MAISRNTAAIVVVLLIIVGVGGYYIDPDPESGRFETITIVAPWDAGTGEKDAFLPTLSEFTARTGIQVKYVTSRAEDLIVTLPLEFAAGTTTGDVIFMTASDVRQFFLDGHAVDVTDLIDADAFPGFFNKEISIDGTFYGGMYTGSMKPGFWYRPSIFEAKGWTGLVPPATLADFKSLLDLIKAEGSFEAPIASGNGVGWPLSDTTEAFIIGLGGPELHRQLQNDEIRWTDPAVVAVFEELVSFIEAGYFSEPDAFDVQFARLWAGDLAMYFQGSFALTFAAIEDPSDLNFFPFPGTTGAIGSPNYFFVSSYSEHPDEAKQLFQWLVSADAQAISAQLPGIIAFHSGIDPNTITSPTNQRLLTFATTIEYLNDLDDTLGQPYQGVFWSQLQLLWVSPESLDDVLAALNDAQDAHIAAMGG
ncbi:MAG: ABC transporter substrate-binding protein [Candidatus Geothermarchaeales archaeon]